jgi:hypothetical protein
VRGKHHFIGCTGWAPTSRNHRSFTIPDYVDENLLSKLFCGEALTIDGSDNKCCSHVVSSHIGLKLKYCGELVITLFIITRLTHLCHIAYTHLVNGKPFKSPILHRPCDAERTIFIPVDSKYCMAIVVPNHKSAHNHPMPPMIKALYDAKAAYRQCITANGVMALTSKKVDMGKSVQPVLCFRHIANRVVVLTIYLPVAASSKLLLDRKTPGQAFPALNNNHVKLRLIETEKLVNAPHGLGLMGKWILFRHICIFHDLIGIYACRSIPPVPRGSSLSSN